MIPQVLQQEQSFTKRRVALSLSRTILRVLASGSDSSEPEDEIYETSLSDKIADWARHFGISLVALSALLGILRLSHPDLPKDGRTLLRTKTKYSIQEKAGGKYYYFGIIHSQIGTAYQQSAFRDTYMEARQILKKALTCSTSDLQTEDEQEQSGRRRTTAKHFFGDRDVEEDYRPPKRSKWGGHTKIVIQVITSRLYTLSVF
ncbi:hypothetical protein R3I94_020166 [Phoxinus phoxinus]